MAWFLIDFKISCQNLLILQMPPRYIRLLLVFCRSLLLLSLLLFLLYTLPSLLKRCNGLPKWQSVLRREGGYKRPDTFFADLLPTIWGVVVGSSTSGNSFLGAVASPVVMATLLLFFLKWEEKRRNHLDFLS